MGTTSPGGLPDKPWGWAVWAGNSLGGPGPSVTETKVLLQPCPSPVVGRHRAPAPCTLHAPVGLQLLGRGSLAHSVLGAVVCSLLV